MTDRALQSKQSSLRIIVRYLDYRNKVTKKLFIDQSDIHGPSLAERCGPSSHHWGSQVLGLPPMSQIHITVPYNWRRYITFIEAPGTMIWGYTIYRLGSSLLTFKQSVLLGDDAQVTLYRTHTYADKHCTQHCDEKGTVNEQLSSISNPFAMKLLVRVRAPTT